MYTRITATAARSLVSRALVSLINRFSEHLRQRARRDGFNELLSLSDDMLADIGVNRGDVEWASYQPLEQDAATTLEALRARKGR